MSKGKSESPHSTSIPASDLAIGSQDTSSAIPADSDSAIADLIARLTDRQQTAFYLIASGLKKSEVAAKSEIHRGTIHRWIQKDVHFKAAYNASRARTLELGRARTLALSDLAVDALEAALEDGDRKIAFKVADRLGLFTQKTPGPQTPGGVARSRARNDLLRRIERVRKARELEGAAFRDFRTSITVYDLDDRIWLLMVDRKKALLEEPPETRKEREEIQAGEAEDDEEITRIHQAIRYATESSPLAGAAPCPQPFVPPPITSEE